jgi:hypothetical protein
MNPDYINNSIIENTLNKFSYRPFAQNIEPYLSLKTTNNNKKWDKVFKPYNLNQTIDAKHLGRLPYDHGAYNEREHYNTFSNKTIFHQHIELMNYTQVLVFFHQFLKIDNPR